MPLNVYISYDTIYSIWDINNNINWPQFLSECRETEWMELLNRWMIANASHTVFIIIFKCLMRRWYEHRTPNTIDNLCLLNYCTTISLLGFSDLVVEMLRHSFPNLIFNGLLFIHYLLSVINSSTLGSIAFKLCKVYVYWTMLLFISSVFILSKWEKDAEKSLIAKNWVKSTGGTCRERKFFILHTDADGWYPI